MKVGNKWSGIVQMPQMRKNTKMQFVRPSHAVPAPIEACYADRQRAVLREIMGSLGYKGSKDAEASNDSTWYRIESLYGYAS
jgi:hypothetical protein